MTKYNFKEYQSDFKFKAKLILDIRRNKSYLSYPEDVVRHFSICRICREALESPLLGVILGE